MSDARVVARLEALLERVRARSAGPRPARAGAAPPASLASPESPEADREEPTIPPPPPPAPAPAVVAPRMPTPAPVLELSVDVDVEEAAPVASPARAEEALSSHERLTAVEPIPLVTDFAPPEEVEVPPAPAKPAQAVVPAEAAAEAVEEPPASSRRPLAPQPEERLAEMAFGAAEPRPPLHTPPPESGQLPAAPALDFPEEDTGVRAAPEAVELTPEVTRPERGGGERVAALEGSLHGFRPASFLALLEASLALRGD